MVILSILAHLLVEQVSTLGEEALPHSGIGEVHANEEGHEASQQKGCKEMRRGLEKHYDYNTVMVIMEE